MVKSEMELKIDTHQSKHVKFKVNKNTLQSDSIKNSVQYLQHRLIVTSIDMTNDNVAVSYEKRYVPTLMKEVGSREHQGNTSKTYETYVDKSSDQLVNIMLKLFLHILIFLIMLKKMMTINLLAA